MRAFGIAALVLSIVAIFIPVVGALLSGLSGVLAWFSGGKNITFGLSSVIINSVNIAFLSPTLILAATSEAANNQLSNYSLVFGLLLGIQLVAIGVFVAVAVRSRSRDEQ